MISPQQAIDALNEQFGRHPGARALHAKGILCRGQFTATKRAAELTRAAHMQGQPVGVTVRFSNGSGDPNEADYRAGVRGMATKFYLPDGARTDISAQTVPRFPVRTPDAFFELLKATAPNRDRLWRLPYFLVRHPEAIGPLRANAPTLKPASSYAARPYYALHAFTWIGPDGTERHVRYTWLPEAREDDLSTDEARKRGRNYLEEEIVDRLEKGPVRFTLELQIAAETDKVDDPSAAWPVGRERVAAGTMEIAGLETGRETGGDVVVFDPMRLTDGIEATDDAVLRFRSPLYSESVKRRMPTAH